MKETIKLMCEDGGIYDGLCVLLGTITMAVSIYLAIVIWG